MRTYYCISSIQMEIRENSLLDETKRQNFNYMICGFDNYAITSCSVYLASDKTVQFQIERNKKVIYIDLKPKSIIIKSVDAINNIIDLAFEDAEFRAGYQDRLTVKSMRIRNIKNSANKGFSEEDKKKFSNYLKQVHANVRKKVLQIDPSLNPNEDLSQAFMIHRNVRENEFDKVKMPGDGKLKSLTNSFRDLITVIEFFNDEKNEGKMPEDLRLVGVTSEITARKTITIKSQRLYGIEKKRNQKLHWLSLMFYDIQMGKFDDIWFDAVNLETLILYKCQISDTSAEAWKAFANGIEKLKNLLTFNLCATLDSIPDIVFQKLPARIYQMDLSWNNFQHISPYIFTLKNLNILSLSNNPKLSQIPWNFPSKTLLRLDLSNTDVTFIPTEISEFSNLEHLNLAGTRLKNLELNMVKLEELKLGYVVDIEKIHAPHIKDLEIANTDLRGTNITALISKFPNLKKLKLMNVGLSQIVFPNGHPDFKVISLSKNILKTFPWESISNQCDTLNLSDNEIEILGSPKFWSNIKWFNLKDNKIHTIEMEGCDFESFRHNPERDGIRFGKELNLQNNPIKALPAGFEKLEFITSLNISGAKIDSQDLENKLWNRIPKSVTILNISKIPVSILPCHMKNLSKIIANDCQLRWICPYLSKNLTMLEVTENPKIKSFPFVPDEVFLYPPKKVKADIEECTVFGNTLYDLEEALTFLTDYSFQDTSDADENCLNYTFKKVDEIEPNGCCKCCAQCGEETNGPLIEELMTMDCVMYVKKKKIVEGWSGEEWKVWVKSRLCEECIESYKRESVKVNEEQRIKLEKIKEKEETKKRKATNKENQGFKAKAGNLKESQNSRNLLVPIESDQELKSNQEVSSDNNHPSIEYIVDRSFTHGHPSFPSTQQSFQQVNDSNNYQQNDFVHQSVQSMASSSSAVPTMPSQNYATFSNHLHLPNNQIQSTSTNFVDSGIAQNSINNYQTMQQMPTQHYSSLYDQRMHQYIPTNSIGVNMLPTQLQQYQYQNPVNNANAIPFNNLSLIYQQIPSNNQNPEIQYPQINPPYHSINNMQNSQFQPLETFEQNNFQPQQSYSIPYQSYQQNTAGENFIQNPQTQEIPEHNLPLKNNFHIYNPSEY